MFDKITKQENQVKDIANIVISYITKLNFIYPVCIYGDIGIGKTTLIKEIISSLCSVDAKDILSPSFSIMYEYFFNEKIIYHIDLYRINHFIEIEELGLLDILENNMAFIEWPEILIKNHHIPHIAIHIKESNNDKERIYIISKVNI